MPTTNDHVLIDNTAWLRGYDRFQRGESCPWSIGTDQSARLGWIAARDEARAAEAKSCPDCGHDLMPPSPVGEAGDDSWYCEGCGAAWSLDLSRRVM